MKTNIIANNTVINTIMNKYMKYICAFLLVIGTSASAWGASCTLKIWDKSAGAYRDWLVINESYTFTTLCDYPNDGSNYYCVLAWAPSEYGSSAFPSSGTFYYYSETYGTRGTPSVLYAVYQDPSADPYQYTSKPNSFQIDFNDCTNPSATVSPTSKSVAYEASAFSLTASRSGTGTVTWTSSNTSVASLSSTSATGATVTPGRAGTATITYSVAEKGDYCAGSATCEVTVTAKAPTVSHNTASKVLEVTDWTARTATFVGGVVTNDGGADIAKYGFVVGTAYNVTVSTTGAKKAEWNTSIAVGTKYGSKTVTGLLPNTTYYVRAYAKNESNGTYGYSTAVSFTTLNEYTISYNNNGGSGTISSQTKEEDATAVLNGGASFSKTGYELERWDTNSGGTGTSYALSGSYAGNADLELYAIWTPQEYTITLNNQSATTTGSTSITVTYGESTNLTGTPAITVPAKTGYTFGGYYTEINGGGAQIIAANGNVNAEVDDGVEIYTTEYKEWLYAGNITLYAKWTANSISLTLNKNNNDVSSTANGSATIKYDAIAVDATPTHATRGGDYNLVGYYTDAACTAANKVLDASGNVVNSTVSGYTTSGKWTRTTTPTTLYAKWSLTSYTVTFNMHGHGAAIDAQDVESGDKVIEPETPTAEDWRFLGWYKEDTYTNKWVFSTQTVTADATIHAKWEAITYDDDTYKAWCEPDITISGNIHLTSVNGVYVQSTSATNNLLTISSTDLSGVDKLDIKYLDADNRDAVVANASSLFRLCNNGISPENYNTADGSQINVSAANTCDLSYSIRYTPSGVSAAGTIHHYKLQVTMKRGTRAVKTVTHDLYGRTLPEEFVLAMKDEDNYWYALPNTIVDNGNAIKPIKISVDNPSSTPTKATFAPTTTVYKGDGRHAAGSNVYGIRFTDGVLKDAKYDHLQVSSTPGTNYMWLSYTSSSTCQDWMLLTEDLSAYTLKLPTSGNATKQMGINNLHNMGYFDSPTVGTVYILPIDSKLTDEPASVTEWGRKSVILDVDAQSASSARAHFSTGEPETAASFGQTGTSVKGSASKYNYTLSFSTLDFSNRNGELLYVDWLDEENQVLSTSTVPIPWIIATSGKMTDKGTKDEWKDAEVHVLPEVTLEADAGDFDYNAVAINILEIYPGATVNVTKGTHEHGSLNASTLVLRNGWTRAGSKEYDVARLYINPDGASLTKPTNAYMDWYIDYDQYYPIAVPWDVTIANITYKNSNSAASAGMKLCYYDGNQRVGGEGSTPNAPTWKQYGATGNTAMPTKLEPSKGYALTAKRPTGKAFSILRMPLTIPSTTWTTNGEQGEVSGTHKDQVSVTAHDNGSTPWYAKGWNFIGNPYMSVYQGTVKYENGDEVAYATIPDWDFKDFSQIDMEDAELKPGNGFFVQAEETGLVTFATGNRKPKASYQQMLQDVIIKANIKLQGESGSDIMGLRIGEQYVESYEINADLAKVLGDANTVKTYMVYGEMNLAYAAINPTLAKSWIPVTINIPTAGEYTFSLNSSRNADHLEGVYLIDHANGDKVTNLIEEDYTFSEVAGTNSERFALNAIVGERQTPTDVDATNGGTIDPEKAIKFMYREKVYILYHGEIYDSTGKKVK